MKMKNPLKRKGKNKPAIIIDDEEAIRQAISLSLLDYQAPTQPTEEQIQITQLVDDDVVTERPPVPVFTIDLSPSSLSTFEEDLKKAIQLSLEQEQTLHRTSAEADLRRAVALSLESARRKGFSLSDPEDDLRTALSASLKSAGLEGIGESFDEPIPPPRSFSSQSRRGRCC
eukprot:c11370_g1_i2.p2 GENE.c11370_g1_i2~~c11370_g1_i2.p2  ORF type:complete len:189 (-),score=50.83 c11370_g1_i2:593-1108(-)